MTKRQLQLYRFIKRYVDQHGVAPLYSEMMEEMGCVKSGINRLISALVERGILTQQRAKTRGLRLATQPSHPYLAVAFRMENDNLVKRFTLSRAGWAEL